ncbi:uncharacterized protein [Dysidea avara]|uniref:uncharacterized protein n=1 Tax=Dysidea avara TaxID=196820 RepID=UPI00332CE7DE
MTYKVQNPNAQDRDLFFILDPTHLLKTIRNCMYNSKRRLWCNGKDISWKHLKQLYLYDTGPESGLRMVRKLKNEHIYLTSFSKMSNFSSSKKDRKLFQVPFRKGDFQLKGLKEEWLPYLQDWEDSVSKREGYSAKAKSMMLLSHETRLGIHVTAA